LLGGGRALRGPKHLRPNCPFTWAKIDSSEWVAANPLTAFTQSDWRGGWTVGAGIECG